MRKIYTLDNVLGIISLNHNQQMISEFQSFHFWKFQPPYPAKVNQLPFFPHFFSSALIFLVRLDSVCGLFRLDKECTVALEVQLSHQHLANF